MDIQEQLNRTFTGFRRIDMISSMLGKTILLREWCNNKVGRGLLRLAYDPYTQFYIKKMPKVQPRLDTTEYSQQHLLDFFTLAKQLSNRDITGNAAREALEKFMQELNEDEMRWYCGVLSKDLKLGIADKTINKAIPNIIPTYEVMLADKIEPVDLGLDTPRALKVLPKHICTQYKIDGYRLNIIVNDDGSIELRTRNGKMVYGYNDLVKDAAQLPCGYVYDGEIVAPELFAWIQSNAASKDTEIDGKRQLFAEVMSHAFSKEDNKQGIFNIFDMVPLKNWKNHDCPWSYAERLQSISSLVKPLNLPSIMVVPTGGPYDRDNPDDRAKIIQQFHQFLDIGWEGLMIKDMDAPYQWKRTKALLKMKLMDTIDLEVLDVFEGEGKYTGMLGGVICEYKGNQLRVGSGWGDADRMSYWKNKNAILGKTIEIAYQAETQNKQGGYSLSFPVFKGIRRDK